MSLPVPDGSQLQKPTVPPVKGPESPGYRIDQTSVLSFINLKYVFLNDL